MKSVTAVAVEQSSVMLKVEILSQFGGNSSIEQSIIRKSTINEQRDSLDWPSNRLNHSGDR